MGEERRKISWRTFAHSEAYKQHEQRQRSEGGPVLKRGAQPDSAIVQQREQSGQAQPDQQVRQVNWLACDSVEFHRIQRRKDVACDPADCDGFPRAHDEVGQDHHPAGGKADRLRENSGGVCDFTGRIWHRRDQPAVHIADWQQQCPTNCESEDRAQNSATQQPVVHHDQPSHADHRAPAQGKVIHHAEFAG